MSSGPPERTHSVPNPIASPTPTNTPALASDYISQSPAETTRRCDVLNYNSHNPWTPPSCVAARHFPSALPAVTHRGTRSWKEVVLVWFLSSGVSALFAELPTALCWDRASGGSQPLWSVEATMRRAQGRLVCQGPRFVGGGGT